jgi:hypothetical protein
MSGLAGFNRTTQSFGSNISGSKAEMDKRKAGLYDRYNQNVRGAQDEIAFMKQKYLADSAQAIQAKIDQGKQLAETAVGGAMVQGGIKSGIGLYRTAQAARAAKISADAAKAGKAGTTATKAGSEATEDGDAASKAFANTGTYAEMPEKAGAGAAKEGTYATMPEKAGTGVAKEGTYADMPDSKGGTMASMPEKAGSAAAEEETGGAEASEVAQATAATAEVGEDALPMALGMGEEGAGAVASGAASLLGTASSAATAAAEGLSGATAALGAASDAITAGVGEAAESGGMSLLPSLLAAGGVEESVAAGVLAAAPEIGGAIILGSTLAYGLYDVFHHGAPNAPPKMPELPTYNAGPGVSPALVKARNQFTTPSFDSVIDTPAASAAF